MMDAGDRRGWYRICLYWLLPAPKCPGHFLSSYSTHFRNDSSGASRAEDGLREEIMMAYKTVLNGKQECVNVSPWALGRAALLFFLRTSQGRALCCVFCGSAYVSWVLTLVWRPVLFSPIVFWASIR